MNKNSLSDEKLGAAAGGVDIILDDEQQARIKEALSSKDDQIKALNEELKKYQRSTVEAEVLNDIYNTNREAKKDSTMMTQIGKDVGVIK